MNLRRAVGFLRVVAAYLTTALLFLAFASVQACDARGGRADAGSDAAIDGGGPVVVALEDLIREVGSLDHLARRPSPAYHTLQASSWDRRSIDPSDLSDEGWFANLDLRNFTREIEVAGRRELVMAEAEGAGAIMRIWSAGPVGTVRVYVDDMEHPVIERSMESLLSASDGPFGQPFSYVVARGANLYFPIPFSHGMRVTTDAGDGDPGLYYHVNYRIYDAAVEVEPWSERAMATAAASLQASRDALADPDAIAIGERMSLTLPARVAAPTAAGGVIRRLQLRIPGADAAALRESVLVIRCDGQETVRTPVGDFFGTGPGPNELNTFALEVDEAGTFVSRFPMPFAEHAEIMIEGALAAELEVVVDGWDFDATSQYFHAGWGSTGVVESFPHRDEQVVELTGAGTYVGMHLAVVNPIDEWWGEGDEKIYVDGDSAPTWFGTGTEDYFGYAHTDLALFSAPFHAQSRTGGTTQRGHISNLRVHVIDAIPFTSSFDFDLELWTWASSEIAFHWVVYWYSRGAVSDLPPLSAGGAAVLDPAAFRR